MAAPPDVSERGTDPRRSLAFRAGRVAAVVAILVMIGFWAWIFSGGPKKTNPDRVGDRAFVERTADRCDALKDRLDELPNAAQERDAGDRANVLDRANVEVDATLDAITADAPRNGSDAKVVGAWLRDWRTYLADRESYADRLRQDPKAQFTVSESPLKDGVDKTIEVFADVNDMPQCATPGDVG